LKQGSDCVEPLSTDAPRQEWIV